MPSQTGKFLLGIHTIIYIILLPISEIKEIFNLYDEGQFLGRKTIHFCANLLFLIPFNIKELDGKIDGTQVGEVARACGLKPTNAMVWKAAGAEYKKKGEKRLTFEEWYPIYEQLSKEKVLFLSHSSFNLIFYRKSGLSQTLWKASKYSTRKNAAKSWPPN